MKQKARVKKGSGERELLLLLDKLSCDGGGEREEERQKLPISDQHQLLLTGFPPAVAFATIWGSATYKG